MKRIFAVTIVFMALFSCAKVVTTTSNDEQRAVFDAWVWKNHKDVYDENHLGGYIFEDETVFESDKELGNAAYIFVYYTRRSLNGEIVSTNEEEMQKQLGTYSPTAFHGPEIWKNDSTSVFKGLRDILRPNNNADIVVSDNAKREILRKGVRRTGAIPGYLQSVAVYSTLDEYFKNITDGTSMQYSLLLVDGTNDIVQWQIDTMERSRIYKALAKTEKTDSLSHCFYYQPLTAVPEETGDNKIKPFPSDTTLQIRYTGRLLDGYVFDTNIADTAKVHNLYSASSKYTPLKIRYNEDWSKIGTSTNSSEKSDLISGFCMAINEMGKKRTTKAVSMFYSGYAYGANSNAGKYPAYSPMIFEFEIVNE